MFGRVFGCEFGWEFGIRGLRLIKKLKFVKRARRVDWRAGVRDLRASRGRPGVGVGAVRVRSDLKT